MSSNRTSNLSAFLFRNSIESRSITPLNISLQVDQQRSTAETQHENRKLKLNIIRKLKLEAKNE